MTDYDDLDAYNGDPVHDMYVDTDYAVNTGDLPYADSEDAGSPL